MQSAKTGSLGGAVVIMQLLEAHLRYKYLCGFLFASTLWVILRNFTKLCTFQLRVKHDALLQFCNKHYSRKLKHGLRRRLFHTLENADLKYDVMENSVSAVQKKKKKGKYSWNKETIKKNREVATLKTEAFLSQHVLLKSPKSCGDGVALS